MDIFISKHIPHSAVGFAIGSDFKQISTFVILTDCFFYLEIESLICCYTAGPIFKRSIFHSIRIGICYIKETVCKVNAYTGNGKCSSINHISHTFFFPSGIFKHINGVSTCCKSITRYIAPIFLGVSHTETERIFVDISGFTLGCLVIIPIAVHHDFKSNFGIGIANRTL